MLHSTDTVAATELLHSICIGNKKVSSTQISYADCLGLSPVISAKIHTLNMRRSLKSQNH